MRFSPKFITHSSLGPSVTMRSVRKSSQRASTISTTHTAHSEQANQAAVRLLILPNPRPCFLVPFVTTITLPPSPAPRHYDNRYRCLMERQSDRRRRVPICTRWRIKLRVSTTIPLLLCIQLDPDPLCSLYSVTTIPGGR